MPQFNGDVMIEFKGLTLLNILDFIVLPTGDPWIESDLTWFHTLAFWELTSIVFLL